MSLIQFLFGFQGRVRRLHLWLYLLAVALIQGGLMWQFGHIVGVPHAHDMTMRMDSGVNMWTGPMGGVYVVTHNPFAGVFGLVLAWTHLAVFVKRWHDRDKSGWWVLINLIPLIGWIWTFIECGLMEGTIGANRFGPDPKPRA